MGKNLEDSIKLFRRVTSLPLLLSFLALLMPLVVFSCAPIPNTNEPGEKIASFNAYELARGISLQEVRLENEHLNNLLSGMEKMNPRAYERLSSVERPNYVLWGIFAGILLSSIFAWWTPLGSLVMALCSFASLWFFIEKIGSGVSQMGAFIVTSPGHGAFAASALLIISMAMNLSTIVRSMRSEKKEKVAGKISNESSAEVSNERVRSSEDNS